MDNKALIESFSILKNEKNISKESLVAILQEAIHVVLRKKFGSSENCDIIIDLREGDFEIWRNRIVVKDEEIEDDNAQISLSEAKKIGTDFELGEEASEKVEIKDFGRRSIILLRQTLHAKMSEYDGINLYKKFKDRIGEMIHVEVYHILSRYAILRDEEQNEMILPKSEQIPSDFFRKGDFVYALVKEVEWKDGKTNIVLSRKDPMFLKRLFELEIPEIADGIITIKKIARIAGEKSKVAVETTDDLIDPVGACVGMRGSRIHSIVRELKNENIDVVNYSENIELYITRALNPAQVLSIEIDEELKHANIYMKAEEISKAIGRNGQNIRLASQLTDYKINIFRNVSYEEDVELSEFSDEIEPWIIEEFHKIGLDTAKSILGAKLEDIKRRTDMDENTIEKVFKVLKKEFE